MKHLTLLLFFIVAVFFGKAQNTDITIIPEQNQLVVFLVRHAEKVDSSRDPELSEFGKERAQILAQTLISSELEYVHSTNYIRTKNTAAPVAIQFGLDINMYDPRNLPELVEKLKKIGGKHLVVGHSNTTPQMVELLGGDPGIPIEEKSEYDRLYILSFNENGIVRTVLMRYGEKYKPLD